MTASSFVLITALAITGVIAIELVRGVNAAPQAPTPKGEGSE